MSKETQNQKNLFSLVDEIKARVDLVKAAVDMPKIISNATIVVDDMMCKKSGLSRSSYDAGIKFLNENASAKRDDMIQKTVFSSLLLLVSQLYDEAGAKEMSSLAHALSKEMLAYQQ